MHQREPTLDDLLGETIIRQVMVADGYEPDDIRLLMRQASARANRTGSRLQFSPANAQLAPRCYFPLAGAATSCCSPPS
jgi:hypothetical protein